MKPIIEYPDFDKLDLRIGQVIEAAAPEWSRKLLQFKVDFGPELGQKMILSGVKEWYSPADFLNKKFAFVVNLAERKMGQGVSQGMMIMADLETGEGSSRAVVLPVDQSLPNGTSIR